jgi:hypothetical protein
MTAPSDQRSQLLAAKLAALAGDHLGADVGGAAAVEPFPGGAALIAGDEAWVLLDERPETALGRALAWASRHPVSAISVVADAGTGVLARRAAAFALQVEVYAVSGRQLIPASAEPVTPRLEPSAAELEAAAMLVDAGIEVVVEHGEVRGEVRGLEMARVVRRGGDIVVEPGVGRHDRDGHATMLAGADPAATLARVAADLAGHRRAGVADHHPLGRMARERWLRRFVLDQPDLVGAVTLEPVEPTVPRQSVLEVVGAFAVGSDADGGDVVVGCSSGIDLDLVPAAADVRLVHEERTGRTARLVLVAPERDLVPVTRRLAGALHRPAQIVAVADDWHQHGAA